MKNPTVDIDGDAEFGRIYEACRPYTMTSKERMYALYNAVCYLDANSINGDLVECGVWKGGSVMLCALILQLLGDTSRRIFLYDTFSGMSEPTHRDVDLAGNRAADLLARARRSDHIWAYSSRSEVETNLATTGMANDRFVLIEGKVEDTIPATAPDRIALLRLDTDWYESTLHELTHLFPLLTENGVLIIDDYGHHKGAKEATDTYFADNGPMLLNRIDYTGRIGLKTA